jgi:hypothetical protein
MNFTIDFSGRELFFLSLLLSRPTIGFLANKLYLLQAIKTILKARNLQIDKEDRLTYIYNKGGVDAKAGFAGVIINMIVRFIDELPK